MIDITLESISYSDCTLGRIKAGNYSCFTLELPDAGNKQNISCIPAGIYRYKKRISPSKGCEVIELIDVPNRSYIQIHIGNRTDQILGCILPGVSIEDYNDDGIPDIVGSEAAFNNIMSSTPSAGTIEIIRR